MKRILSILIAFAFVMLSINAQTSLCKVDNKYFQSGEELSFDLYFKFGFLTKAGTSTLKVSSEKYNGTDAYKMSLVASSTGAARKIFALDDTLTIYTTKDIVPLRFIKRAHEGSEHTNEDVSYTYKSSGVSIKTYRQKNGVLRFDETVTSEACVYELLSIIYYARTIDFPSMKKGDKKVVECLSGRDILYMVLQHGGTETISANDGKKYECVKLVMSLSKKEDTNFDNKVESMTIYVSNDNNRMPIRMDSKLNYGSTRAILKSYKGNRHAVTTP